MMISENKAGSIFYLKIFAVCLFAAIFVFTACGKKPAKPLLVQESIRVEASFFRANCATCHGKEAEGGDLGGREVPSLREGAAVKKSDEELHEQIANGKNGMPPYKFQLTDEQIRNMVKFIRDLQKPHY